MSKLMLVDEQTVITFRSVFLDSPEGRTVLAILLRDLGYAPQIETIHTEEAMTKINIARQLLAYCGCVSDDDSIPYFLEALSRAPIATVSEERAKREAAGLKRLENIQKLQDENYRRRRKNGRA